MCSAEPPLYTRGGKFNVADKMYTHLLQNSNFQKLSLLPPSQAMGAWINTADGRDTIPKIGV